MISPVRSFVVALVVLLSLPFVRADNILFIGNSYTGGGGVGGLPLIEHGGVPKLLEAIAQAKGKQVTTEAVIANGQTWGYHLEHPAAAKKIGEKPWTWVILQDHSARQTMQAPKDGPAAFLKDGGTLYDLIVKASPGAKILLYQTWARPPAFFQGDNAKSEAMYKAVRAAYEKLQVDLAARPQKNEVRVAPVGTAFWQLEGNQTMNLHDQDNHHANNNGYYLAALVLYETIYHESVAGAPVSFFGGEFTVTPEDAAKLQAEADAVVTGK